MKKTAKIVVFIFLQLFIFPGIALLIQQILGFTPMRLSWYGIIIALMGPYFFTYSKWANDNIWNRTKSKPVETIKPKPKKTSKADNSNSEYIKIDKKLFNTILIVLGVIVVFYIGYISGGSLNVSTQTINYNENEEYFEWFYTYDENDYIESEILNYKGSPFTGVVEEYHENGQLYSRTNYKDGKYVGISKSYYESGQLHQKGTYKDGVRHGPWEVYYKNGQVSEKLNYKDNLFDGLYETYHENGQLEEKINFKDDLRYGLIVTYDENGQVLEKSTYKLGECISGDCLD